MLDQIEYRIARELSEHHLYPFASDIYTNIFKNFSHFPVSLKDLGLKGEGETITFLAFAVKTCFDTSAVDFSALFHNIMKKMNQNPASIFKYNLTVEAFIGCALYHFHPSNLRSALNTYDVTSLFDSNQLHEYAIKKETVLIHTI